MRGAITRPSGVSVTHGAVASMVKNTAPVRRTARSTSESVSLIAALADGRSCQTDGGPFRASAVFITTAETTTHSTRAATNDQPKGTNMRSTLTKMAAVVLIAAPGATGAAAEPAAIPVTTLK